MRLVRYVSSTNQIQYGTQHEGGGITRLDGDILGTYRDTGAKADVAKLLAPLVPRNILCIGLNYRRHAEEGKQPIPAVPGAVHQEHRRPAEPGRPDRAAAAPAQRQGRLRMRTGRRHRQALQERRQGGRPRVCARLHLRQRRQRPRLAAGLGRRPMVPGQVVRHFLPARPVPGHHR